jgi:predicted PurR-regulated permease PerM
MLANAVEMPDSVRRRAIVEVSWKTLLKVIAAAALVWLWLQLYQIVLVVIVAILLAVTLNPVVRWLERRLSRWGATAVVSLVLLGLVGGFLWMTWSSLSDQAQYAGAHFSEFERHTLEKLPPWLRNFGGATAGDDIQSRIAPYALRVTQSAASAVVVAALGFILTVYLLIEGRRTRDWVVAFVPAAQRGKVCDTLDECERVIFGYVAGNVATSVFATVFVLIVLSILKVPAALLLAVLAGLFDFIPVLGFICSALPAVLLAMTVSGTTALMVAALYIAYHGIENYGIAPYVYGDRLKLSNLAVILAFAVGAEIAGVIGALIALPLAAVYPAVERIWLKDKLAEDTVTAHRAMEHRKAG